MIQLGGKTDTQWISSYLEEKTRYVFKQNDTKYHYGVSVDTTAFGTTSEPRFIIAFTNTPCEAVQSAISSIVGEDKVKKAEQGGVVYLEFSGKPAFLKNTIIEKDLDFCEQLQKNESKQRC